jgi:hypothetical protein
MSKKMVAQHAKVPRMLRRIQGLEHMDLDEKSKSTISIVKMQLAKS